MSKDYLLGIDIGTSACKVAIFNKNGKVMASANGDYPVYYPHEGWAQQKPDEWWHAVCGAICECLKTGNISVKQLYCLQTDWCHYTGSFTGIWPALL